MADNSAAAEEQQTEEQLDLDATLAAEFDRLEKEEAEQAEVTAEQPEEQPPEEPKTADRERDESGRFKAREEPKGEEPPAEEPKAPEQDEQPRPESTVRRPPSSWSAKAKSEFNKLPDHIQDEVLKREDDFHKGLEQYRDSANFGQSMDRLLQPYQPYLRSKGASPEQTVASMLQTAYMLDNAQGREKTALFKRMAQKFGVDLSELQTEQGQVDPQVQHLQQQIQHLQGQIQSSQQAAQQQSMTEAYSSIEAFRNEVDEAGNPSHLYFDDVRDEMADMIEAAQQRGQELTLQQAYDAAIWARPDIRETLLTKQQQEAEEKRKAEAAKKAADAKKRAGVNVQTTGAYPNAKTSQAESIDETLEATMDQIAARNE